MEPLFSESAPCTEFLHLLTFCFLKLHPVFSRMMLLTNYTKLQPITVILLCFVTSKVLKLIKNSTKFLNEKIPPRSNQEVGKDQYSTKA